MTQRVLIDANVISSRTLSDWLFHLQRCNEGMFSLFWSLDIQAEAVRVMRRRFPKMAGEVVEKRFKMMEHVIGEKVTFPDGDYGFTGSDEGDFHVHAAAVYGEADYLLTFNSPSDFTTDPATEPYEIISPDEFLVLVADSDAGSFRRATREQREYFSKAGRLQSSITDGLEKAGCPVFAARVKTELSQLALNT
nr:Uncharacterised protein [Streptococcus thermophilus]